MVIDKFLKVNAAPDPKVDELKARLAALQQKAQGTAQTTQVVQSPAQTPTLVAQPAAAPQKAPERALDRAVASIQDPRITAVMQNPELKLREERTTNLIMNQIKELITLHTDASKRLKDVEVKQGIVEKEIETMKDKHEELLQKMNTIDSRLEKFMGLYELVTNQYNPFAQSAGLPQQPALAAAKPVTPTAQAPVAQPLFTQPKPLPIPPKEDMVVKVEDNLTKQAASIAVSGTDNAKAQERFKHVEELLADLQKKHEQHHVSEPSQQVQEGVHSMLSGFEVRLQKHLDKALAEQLHQHFTKLENTVQQEVRDALKDEIASVQQGDRDVQQAFSELQEMLQSAEGKNREPVEEELTELSAEITKLRDDVKAIPPNLYFRVADGLVLKDLQDLKAAFDGMKPEAFASHVGGGRNDFADWVEHALLLPSLAKQLRDARTQKDMLQVLQPTF